MKFLVTADLHVTNKILLGQPRLEVFKTLLNDLLDLADKHHVRHLFIVGDLWNKKNILQEMEVLLCLHKWFKKAVIRNIRVHWIRGNHECLVAAKPSLSPMALFSEVCHVICKPTLLQLGDVSFYMLPWYLPKTYLEKLAEFNLLAATDQRKRILMTHIGLKEGAVSPSNLHVPQRVSVTNLLPGIWDLILLGDYHAHQFLERNCFYVGSPIPHTFGDYDNVGPWLVDTRDLSVEALDLPNHCPTFQTFTIMDAREEVPFKSPGYLRLRVPARIADLVKLRFPDAQISAMDQHDAAGENVGVADMSSSRFSADDLRNPEKLITRYLEKRKIVEDKEKFLTFGMRILKEAREA